jgi:hypothetical protein
MSPFSSFRIAPDYLHGFMYLWEVSGGFDDPAPWIFQIQMGPTEDGPWKNVSPELRNIVAWRGEGGKFLYNKSNILYFRMVLRTPKAMYFSPVVQPYGDLSRRDFILAREIMRRECLRGRVLSGVQCDVYIRSTFGPKCTCLDPVTGYVRDSHCRKCFGTGRYPAYYGPHKMVMSFSTDVAHSNDNSTDGTHETKMFEALAIGNPVLKKGDVVVDVSQDKRYVVGTASVVSEVRRIACLQKVGFDEAPLSDPIYRLGKDGDD